MSETELLACPWCGEPDFDLVGLKSHVENRDCAAFNETEGIARVFRRTPVERTGTETDTDMETSRPMPPGFDPVTRTYTGPEYELADRIVRETEHLDDPREAIAQLLREPRTSPEADAKRLPGEDNWAWAHRLSLASRARAWGVLMGVLHEYGLDSYDLEAVVAFVRKHLSRTREQEKPENER